MSERFSRRDFLFIGGATLAGVTLGQAGRTLLSRGDERLGAPRGQGAERWAASVCRQCPAACGVRVRLVDGVPVKLEGNPACPIGRGRLCAKGQAALESYFDPDRLVGPARRTGKRGDQRWEPISWDAAVALLVPHLAVRNGDEASRPVALGAEERGPVAEAWSAFWRAAGAQCAWTPAATAGKLRATLASLTGVDRDPIFDIEHATYVLSFGAPIAEDWLSAVWSQRSYGRFRGTVPGGRGRLVHVDVHRSMTARKADEWLSIPQDRQTMLALGVASVILRENRANRDFLDLFGGRLDQFQKDVTDLYPPDEVAAATGVPVVTLLRLARELSAAARPVAVCGADAPPVLASAVFALNALTGSLDREGGVFASPAPAVASSADAVQTLREMAVGAIRPRLVAFRDSSSLRALDWALDAHAAVEHAALVVSFSPYLDEAASVADLLLPSPTSLESAHAVVPPSVVAADCVALAGAAVAPRLETRDCLAVLAQAAAKAGREIAAACTWKQSGDVVDGVLDRLFAARRGGPYSNVHENAWLRELESGGWWVAAASSREAFAAAVLDAGGWSDPYFEPGAIRSRLGSQGGVQWPTARLAQPLQAAAARPNRWVSLSSDEEFPLHLVVFTPPAVGLVAGANHPVVFEILGQPEGQPWRVWAEMSADTAEQFKVAAGSNVRITSQYGGSVDAVAIVVDGMVSGAVALAYVPSIDIGGRWSGLLQADARTLFGPDGAAAQTSVRIAPV